MNSDLLYLYLVVVSEQLLHSLVKGPNDVFEVFDSSRFDIQFGCATN